MHRLTKTGDIIIHCLPSQGFANHAFYSYHPLLIAELAKSNGYEVGLIFFTANFTPKRVLFALQSFQAKDSRDILLYAVVKKLANSEF